MRGSSQHRKMRSVFLSSAVVGCCVYCGSSTSVTGLQLVVTSFTTGGSIQLSLLNFSVSSCLLSWCLHWQGCSGDSDVARPCILVEKEQVTALRQQVNFLDEKARTIKTIQVYLDFLLVPVIDEEAWWPSTYF
ncbi:hypothetical protein NC653_012918 [Populus alba x Populus x berolinensis]|uniref:Uncharacterized protein n=1 Tax=Populus alba x Populus x berolinensis TaxID=444605 RepID=A0AAD6W206_9ROSI|nr:hypothetical protein NC653_012918 [Populus alba x Populus x berolinensis]